MGTTYSVCDLEKRGWRFGYLLVKCKLWALDESYFYFASSNDCSRSTKKLALDLFACTEHMNNQRSQGAFASTFADSTRMWHVRIEDRATARLTNIKQGNHNSAFLEQQSASAPSTQEEFNPRGRRSLEDSLRI